MSDLLTQNEETLRKAAKHLREVKVRFDAHRDGKPAAITAMPQFLGEQPEGTFDLVVVDGGYRYTNIRFDQIEGEVELLPESQATTHSRCVEQPLDWPEQPIEKIMDMDTFGSRRPFHPEFDALVED